MGLLLPNRELGFYGAATNISSIAMLMSPIMNWVVTPQLARSAHDRGELVAMVRRALEWTVVLALPVALMLELGADVVIHTVFGAKFGPATGAMRALAPVFVLVYAAMLGATGLMLLDRAWTVTLVTASSFVVNAVLNVLLVRPAFAWLGEGGGGIGAAAITVFTEAVVVGIYVTMLGRDVFDRASLGAIARSLGVCAAVTVLHVLLRQLGPVRLLLDVVAYCVLAFVTRAIRVGELYPLLVASFRSRKNHANT
jgi:O-antigen/teichoic acid export membrane protein